MQDREEDPVRLDPVRTARGGRGDPHGVDSVGDHYMHVALRCRRQLARDFFRMWVCRLNLLDAAK